MSHFNDPASPAPRSGVLPKSFPWLILTGLLAGMALSLPLWLSRRHFPLVPCFDWLPSFPAPWDAVVLGLAVLPLFPALWREKWARLAWVSLGAFLLLALQDQVRWQPWVYQYFLALAVWFSLNRRQPDAHAALQRLMIVAVYLWSGLHKLGPGFRHLHDQAFATPLRGKFPAFLVEALAWIGPLVPWIEIALAIGLLVPIFRKASVAGILLMHGYIVWSLVWVLALPNTVVLPWNVCMMALVPLLFWRKHRVVWPSLATRPARPLTAPLAFLLAVAPVLSEWEKWDRYLAFHLYSGKERRMVMSPTVAPSTGSRRISRPRASSASRTPARTNCISSNGACGKTMSPCPPSRASCSRWRGTSPRCRCPRKRPSASSPTIIFS